MKNVLIVFIVVGVLGIGIYGVTSLSAKKGSMVSDSSMKKEETIQTETMVKDEGDEEVMKKDEDKMMANESGGQYVPYTSSVLSDAAGGRRVLFFYANWCTTCRPSDADFTKQVSRIPAGVTLIRVNYNDSDTDQEEKNLAKQYAVTYQHTFVEIDKTGAEVSRWTGGQTDELLAHL